MTSQGKMQFPFKTKEEIYDWAKCYIDVQTGAERRVEQYLIGLKNTVLARNSHGGYLHKDELYDLVYWKSNKSAHWINHNCESFVKEITTKAFCLNDDWKKLKKLTGSYGGLKGVGPPVASAILHLYDRKKYPILDKHALCSLGINHEKVKYDCCFWKKYVEFCCVKAKCYDVSMRTLDRALWKFSQSGAQAARIVIPDKTLLLELARRNYPLSKLRDKEMAMEWLKRA